MGADGTLIMGQSFMNRIGERFPSLRDAQVSNLLAGGHRNNTRLRQAF
jgi:hypothetical protein